MYYRIIVLVRPDDQVGPEQPLKARVAARTKLEARRIVLECAWAIDLLVSQFLEITPLRSKK